jgi:RsiW-degrading membrane proteinase PrsW (M82 family)
MVLVNRDSQRETGAAGAADALYWLQLGGFAAYSGLIGYLLVDRVERGTLAVATYTFAMAVHFLIVDHSLE